MNNEDFLKETDLKKGLSNQKVQERLAKFGCNELPVEKAPSDFALLFDQLKSPLIYVLLVASFITFITKDFADTVVILLAVLINTILGFYQERKASRALLSLKKILTPYCRVIRDGEMKMVEVKLLVQGDLVILSHGDKIPADGVLVEGASFSANEAILTGESFPVAKIEQQPLYMGTAVSSGRGKMVVTRTGLETEMGKIAEKLRVTPEGETPLQKRLSVLARHLAFFVFGVSLFIFVVGILSGRNVLLMFTTAVALAVAAIPEGLVISLTAILAIGMQRILKRKSLVRRLVAAETLGSVTVIATDKTGTLTEGNLRAVKTEFTDEEQAVRAMIFANNLSDPLEVAMWEWVTKIKNQKSKIKNITEFDPEKLVEENKRVWEVPFDPEKKFMAVGFETGEVYVSGAPEVILKNSKFQTSNSKQNLTSKIYWEEKIEEWGREGMRMVGLAYKNQKSKIKNQKYTEGISDLEWLGLVGFEDPVREGVKEALEICQRAGIRVCVVTGDYRATAEAVLRKIGLIIHDGRSQVMEGYEVEHLSVEELSKRIKEIVLFTRVTPTQKLKIVEALKHSCEVVAIVGDGVNDAPALREADIGIVVGGATETAKETADIVLLDSNFATIVAAVEEGRGIFANLRKIILYLLSDSFSEVILIFGGILLGIPLPLTAAQIIWINLITDGFPNLALTLEPKERELMRRPPIDPKVSLLNFEILSLTVLISGVTGLLTLGMFSFIYKTTGDVAFARTMTFVFLGVDSLLYVFSCRSLQKPIWENHFLSNPWLLLAVFAGFLLQLTALYLPFFQQFFMTKPLNFGEWSVIFVGAFVVILLIESVKFLFRRSYF